MNLENRYGSANGMARLTEGQVRSIRRKFDAGRTRGKLAEKYGVSIQTIHQIVHRRTWRHVV